VIRISYGLRANDAHPRLIECTWQQFVDWLYQHPRTVGDKDGPYVCLAEFSGRPPHTHGKDKRPCDNSGPLRDLDALVASCGIPLDFDAGWVTADIIQARLAGYAFVAYTTYKHQPGAERWRVLLPVVAAMDAETHKATWTYLSSLFNNAADRAASDASRLSYLPGACLDPSAARIFHADGALFVPVPAAPPAPVVNGHGDGPVPGWAGPTDDTEMLTIACNTRIKPSERFGGPIHMAMLWSANEDWLAQNFPPSGDDCQKGRAWNYTLADAALANELVYMTGGDIERSANLLRQSGLAAVRNGDDDWANRKVYAALDLGLKGRGPDQFHFMKSVPAETTAPSSGGAVVATAQEATLANIPMGQSRTMNDFFAYLPDHTYIYRPSGDKVSAASVDEIITKEARQVLAATVPVDKFTWAPGMPERFTLDELDSTHVGGERVWLYNEYRAPRAPTAGGDVSRWLNLLQRLFPDDADHIVNYFADAVQNPGRKCNHALVLGSGVHGTGKDTLLAPLQYAVGDKNFRVIKPYQLAEQFTPWMHSVVVQVSESRDMGEGFASINRYEMYERCKDLAAAPPKSLDCNEKHKGQYPVANVMRLILTTNHQVDGLYMDPQDRRHYCAWSDAPKMTEADAKATWEWYPAGGLEHVAYYLRTLDLAARNWAPKAPPLRTAWWHQLVAGGASQEEDVFSDALDKLGRPEWVTIPMVNEAGGLQLAGWTAAPGNRRKLEREMVKAGYQRLPNPHDPKRGRWYVGPVRQTVYRRNDIPAKTLVARLTVASGGVGLIGAGKPEPAPRPTC
jgi:hypothetical protein